MSKSDFTLWYWVHGYPFSSVESIQVSPDTDVAALRRKLVEVLKLDEPPQAVQLYKVPEAHSVSLDEEWEDVLGELSISHLGSPLRATRRLTSIFAPEPQEDQLHLVVAAAMNISCRIRGADPADQISLKLPGTERLDVLKLKAKELWPPFSDVPALQLRIYKISFSNDDELKEILDCKQEGELIPEDEKVATAFNDIPFRLDVLRIVIEVSQQTKIPPSSYRPTREGDTIESARERFLKDSVPEKPSLTASLSTFCQRQDMDKSKRAIPCGRPRNFEDSVPTVLLHSVFGQFVEDTKNISLTPEDTKFTVDFADAMSTFYSDESKRVEKIQSVLETYDIHLGITKTKVTGYETDGDISTRGYRYVVAEFKNEAGNTSGEPYFQTIGYYLESTRRSAAEMSNSPLPCFLLPIFGPYMVFAGAAWNLRPTVQLLSMPIAFNVHTTDTENLHVLARHMAAFRKATVVLKQYYDALQSPRSGSLSSISALQLFPYPTTYSSLLDHTEKEFVYHRQLHKDKLVFFGSEGSQIEDRICIKFVKRYSVEAHQLCESLGCAPTLRGHKAIPGGWTMIIMDDLSDDNETIYDKPIPQSTKQQIAAKLAELHEAGFVHGDIRDTNIMISKADRTRFKIIDFDWSGRVNQVKYPTFMNGEVWRPRDAVEGQPILPEHDDAMLDRIGRWDN